jgi:hypothetical protein
VAETISNVAKKLLAFIRDASAIVHYFSDITLIISVYNIIFESGPVGAVIIWLIAALISGVTAELLKSRLPTPLRIVLRRKTVL